MSSEEKQGPVLVRSREGEEVTCSREAACRAVTLDNMIKDSADGICPVDLPVVDLRVILGLCEGEVMYVWDCTTAHY